MVQSWVPVTDTHLCYDLARRFAVGRIGIDVRDSVADHFLIVVLLCTKGQVI